MNATILMLPSTAVEMNGTAGYIAGAVIAMVILGYLVYSLVRPEKF